MTQEQQNELDVIERRILILIFGSETIPEKTAVLLKLLKINPNDYIRKFENRLLPLMTESGDINGVMLKALIALKKPSLCSIIDIPDGNFRFSSMMSQIVGSLLPGLKELLNG